MNKTAASAAELSKWFLLHAYSRTTSVLPAARAQTKTSYTVAYLTS